tara:strand:+ start:824 stop:1093 length:270 start_codon:yes stop_codon:yes gene_type:complete
MIYTIRQLDRWYETKHPDSLNGTFMKWFYDHYEMNAWVWASFSLGFLMVIGFLFPYFLWVVTGIRWIGVSFVGIVAISGVIYCIVKQRV